MSCFGRTYEKNSAWPRILRARQMSDDDGPSVDPLVGNHGIQDSSKGILAENADWESIVSCGWSQLPTDELAKIKEVRGFDLSIRGSISLSGSADRRQKITGNQRAPDRGTRTDRMDCSDEIQPSAIQPPTIRPSRNCSRALHDEDVQFTFAT